MKSESDVDGSALLKLSFVVMLFGSVIWGLLNPSPKSPPTPYSGNAEHDYVVRRLKTEGYSDSEAKEGAEAIIKFHDAQRARKR